jgi:23S rRNA pseudouridine1911/1915/1917 synthase
VQKTFLVPDSDRNRRLDLFLAEKLPELSRSRIQHLIADGRVTLHAASTASPQSRVAAPELKPGYRLRGGEDVVVDVEPPAPLRAFPEDLPLEILHEDDDLIAINKPAGMVVHAGAGVKSGTLVNALLHHFGALSGLGGELRPGIVHRLDRNTSGVLLVAKNDAAHQALAAQFARKTPGAEMEKHYTALVHGAMLSEQGTIRSAIRRDPVRRIRMTARPAPEGRAGRSAESRYRVVKRYGGPGDAFTLLDVRILTGRTHQVRVHLSSVKHPIVGDTLYGAPARLPGNLPAPPRTFLHAASIRFVHPRTGAPLQIRAPLPADLEAFLKRLVPLA